MYSYYGATTRSRAVLSAACHKLISYMTPLSRGIYPRTVKICVQSHNRGTNQLTHSTLASHEGLTNILTSCRLPQAHACWPSLARPHSMHGVIYASLSLQSHLCNDVQLRKTLGISGSKQLGQETTLTACRYRQQTRAAPARLYGS